MKIYIAGKITGDPKYRDRFRDEAERLEGLGHIVLNPAELALCCGVARMKYKALEAIPMELREANELVARLHRH